MKHLSRKRVFKRETGQRKALINGLVSSLFEQKRIKTTLAKAKEIRSLSERLITKAKVNDFNNIRYVKKFLRNNKIINELFWQIAPFFQKRNGGYVRIIKQSDRKGDGAHMAFIELVDFFQEGKLKPDLLKKDKKDKSRKN